MPDVVVIMGSSSDLPKIQPCIDTLKKLGISHEVRVMSAHRTPDLVLSYIGSAEQRGVKVVIAAAGGAAHLAGVSAAHTLLPVIGIPVESSALKGIDSLLSTIQMPGGIPVATVGIGSGGATNAALLAAQIIALNDDQLKKRLLENRQASRQKVIDDDAAINAQ